MVEIIKQTVTGDSLRQEFLGNRAQLLLVDSDPEKLTGLELKLVAEGYTVLTTRTSVQAARRLLSKPVDLVISETTLEPVDGFALCESLKRDGRTANIPMLFLSDRSDAALPRPPSTGPPRASFSKACAAPTNPGPNVSAASSYRQDQASLLLRTLGVKGSNAPAANLRWFCWP